MRVFVAGASGAIGQTLIAELVRRGHTVTGMTRSEAGARRLRDLGASVAQISAFDAPAVEEGIRRSQAEVVVDELTALPKHPSEMAAAAPGDQRLRLEGGGNLYRAAQANGVRRYIQQASGFFLRPGGGLADESDGLAVDASPRVAASARTYAELEARLLSGGGNGRGRAPIRLLLRPEYLVQPGRRCRGPGPTTGTRDNRTRGRGLVMGPHRGCGSCHRRRSDGSPRCVQHRR